MVHCPSCGKSISGRAAVCGYCGESLVRDYFSRREPPAPYPTLGGACVAATVLGSFGALSLLAALVLSLSVLFGAGELMSALSPGWWVRTLLLAVLPPVHLVQQLVLHGLRFSMLFDGFWFFSSVCALGFTIQAWLGKGVAAFDGNIAIAYLLALGCALIAVACATGILSFRQEN